MGFLNFTELPQAHQAVVAKVCAIENLNPEALSFQHRVNDEYDVLYNDQPTTFTLYVNTIELD